jgi:hypothetical protein
VKTVSISISLDQHACSAEAPLGVTLREFFRLAGRPLAPESRTLSDGRRALSPDLELAYRHHGASLSSAVPAAMLAETPALLGDELLVLAGKENA